MSLTHTLIQLIRSSNPYYYLGPVPDEAFFFDREEELEDAIVVIKQILGGGTGGVLVLGGRGSGKTSFLEELQRRLDAQTIASAKIPLDPEMVNEGNETLLFSTILQELIKSAYKAKVIDQGTASKFVDFFRNIAKIENIAIDFPGFNLIIKPEAAKSQFSYIVLRDGLNDFIKLIETKGMKKNNRGAVIMLDEGDALTLNPKLLHILRNAFQQMRGISLVIAGSTKLSTQVGVVFSPVPRFFRKIELGPYPSDAIVDQAINHPITINCKELLASHQIRLNVNHASFDYRLKEVVARSPLHINMLCHFAFDIGAKELKIDQRCDYQLRMLFTKELMETAINQLRGTKNYGDFIDSLDEDEVNFLRILSRSPFKLSVKDVAIMGVLDELQDSLQTLPIVDICKTISNYSTILPVITKVAVSLSEKASKYDIDLLGADVLKRNFDIADHWIRAYFKYGSQSFHFNIESTDLPFIGVHFFGDSISSIFHSIFFARLSKFMDPTDNMRAHQGSTDGGFLKPWPHRKLLIIIYRKCGDQFQNHLAFNLRSETSTSSIKDELQVVAKCLVDVGFISDFSVIERANASYR